MASSWRLETADCRGKKQREDRLFQLGFLRRDEADKTKKRESVREGEGSSWKSMVEPHERAVAIRWRSRRGG
ncbi:hypothetical protein NL676_019945 [Syzygium grande]|nr:hypothetical protein NL676_019945 [Syzygium grande]